MGRGWTHECSRCGKKYDESDFPRGTRMEKEECEKCGNMGYIEPIADDE